jgi:hypothetical protein
MIQLNLPKCLLRFSNRATGTFVFDAFRKKYVALTPEEWVRQNFLSWLVNDLGYPRGLIAVEAPLKYNTLQKRADAIVYNRQGSPLMMIECKSAHVEITQDTFLQAARYNFNFNCKYLVLTNGLSHYCSELDLEKKTFRYLEEIPLYDQLT